MASSRVNVVMYVLCEQMHMQVNVLDVIDVNYLFVLNELWNVFINGLQDQILLNCCCNNVIWLLSYHHAITTLALYSYSTWYFTLDHFSFLIN